MEMEIVAIIAIFALNCLSAWGMWKMWNMAKASKPAPSLMLYCAFYAITGCIAAQTFINSFGNIGHIEYLCLIIGAVFIAVKLLSPPTAPPDNTEETDK